MQKNIQSLVHKTMGGEGSRVSVFRVSCCLLASENRLVAPSEGSDIGQARGGQKIVVPALPMTCSVIPTGHSTALGLRPYQNVTDNRQYHCLITKGG